MSNGNTKAPDETLRACRNLLLMVAELHTRGYESLHVMPCMSPSGAYWRCDIGPADRDSVEPYGGVQSPLARYSSSNKAAYYDWDDCAGLSVEALADRFEESFADVVAASDGADPEYVQWFADMLTQTEPWGIIYAFADWDHDETVMHVMGLCERRTLPFAPK